MSRCEECMKKPLHPDKKCCFNCARNSEKCEVWHNCGEDCTGWDKKVVTNADWIRAMTEKELAEFIGHNSLCDRIQGECGNWCNDHNCSDCLEEWLKQPAELPEEC